MYECTVTITVRLLVLQLGCGTVPELVTRIILPCSVEEESKSFNGKKDVKPLVSTSVVSQHPILTDRNIIYTLYTVWLEFLLRTKERAAIGAFLSLWRWWCYWEKRGTPSPLPLVFWVLLIIAWRISGAGTAYPALHIPPSSTYMYLAPLHRIISQWIKSR